MNKAENHKYWSKKVAEFKKSGKTKEEWCQKKNITIKQFTYWLRQFSREASEIKWLPVEIKEEDISKDSAISVKIGTAIVEVYPGFDKEHLSSVLEVLTRLC
jgi:hypothetical protein